MSKSLVLAEKPSVARDIARVLGCNKKGNGFLEGTKYIVTWALGHLVTHADPEGYGNEFKEWKLEHLPIIPDPFKLVPIRQTTRQFNAVKSQLRRNDVSDVIIATDAGREGELVARWILEQTKCRKPVKRLWISSVTDKAIKDGFNNLKPGRAYENLYEAAVARAEADWVVGINATRALTVKHNAQLSTGRVQTPTLGMIAEREKQINEFKPKAYYGMQAITEKATFTWRDNAGQTRSFDKESIEKRLEKLDGIHFGKIKDVKTSPKSQPAPHLFDLTELQKEAHKRWSWSAKETLSTLQNLYEHHKAVTYPRTDSKHLTSDMENTLKERIKAVDFGPFRKTTNTLLRSGTIKPQRGVIDDKRVSDHHAIIPTEETPIYQKLSDREQRLYELIVNRFLAVFFGPFRYDQVTAELVVGNETFNARGRTVTDEGWKKVYASDDDAVETLPSFKKGEEVKVRAVTMTEGKTTPPARFNEGTLLAAMENPTQFMQGESKDLIKTIGESGGLGTVATRADVIERLFKSFVIEKKGNDIFTTSKGRQLLELVPEDLKSPALTAEWEQGLTKIANGKMKKADFMKDMIAFSKQAVTEIKTDDKKFRHDNVTGRTCPDCGKLLLEVNGKRGKMHVCQDRECGYRRSISRQTNARCPVCKKRLELRGEGDGQIFVCSCGHREKLSAFEKRRKESGNRANKRDVQKYMKKQEEPENTAMAEALKKLFDK
ncbi:DNA topoisomerase III [Sporosarcina sp. Marseille-Q4063]|uniref:DNA topoisomerase III n=1 Tax=Sporosarcina sp. Marseille-Q4063 TaxID=2810514 RepID=UPI001BB049DF|nr:DNA topoisomerase III [Sporosarcina sp. Marseille-Q4063]QUW21090.1 DNA topoisomerase III [Sporosarcina sp. Marseille-Q4063]